MRKLIISFVIALTLLSCEKMNETISDASPIQFWPIGGNTFNEAVNAFVDHECYIHEWQCDDQIKLQIGNDQDITDVWKLKILDTNGNTIEIVPYVPTILPYGPNITLATILDAVSWNVTPPNGWSQISDDRAAMLNLTVGTQPSWSFAARAANCGSRYIAGQRTDANAAIGWPPASYNFRVDADGVSTYGGVHAPFTVKVWGSVDGSAFTLVGVMGDIAPDGFVHTLTGTFVTAAYYKYFGFTWEINLSLYPGSWTGTFSFIQPSGLEFTNAITDSVSENDLSFTASGLGTPICDQQVKFILQKDDVDTYKSDYHKFTSAVAQSPGWGSRLMYYKSIANFAGINYPNDGNYFALRIPSRFFHERPKEEENAITLSNSVTLNTSVNESIQRNFELILLPDYMHKKIRRILQHCVRGDVTIDNRSWVREDTYNLNLNDKRGPKKSANVWLTDKNSYVRNVI